MRLSKSIHAVAMEQVLHVGSFDDQIIPFTKFSKEAATPAHWKAEQRLKVFI
jgi:hypothetical protein